MAILHRIHPSSLGAYRERDILAQLQTQLPDSFDIYHSVALDSVWQGRQVPLELDAVVVSPLGHVVILEVKAGAVEAGAEGIRKTYGGAHLAQHTRAQLLAFLDNQFDVVPSLDSHIGQVQRTTTQLAQGLARWVPRMTHPDGVYVIEGTAGSGKTQLALQLLGQAAAAGTRAGYVC